MWDSRRVMTKTLHSSIQKPTRLVVKKRIARESSAPTIPLAVVSTFSTALTSSE